MKPLRSLPDPLEILSRWRMRGWLRAVDETFAHFLRTHAPDADGWLLLAAALTSHQAGRGHVCLDLAALLADPNNVLSLPPEGSAPLSVRDPDLPERRLAGIDLEAWLCRLDHPTIITYTERTNNGATPLVRVGSRLYLRRLWQCEQEVVSWITTRVSSTADLHPDPARIRIHLDALLPCSPDMPYEIDWQRIACARMVCNRFGIITGGPGTGKTTTVVRLLALFLQLSIEKNTENATPELPRIALAAPTGKAAARLSDAITRELERLHQGPIQLDDRIWRAIPRRVTTLHRLLGGQHDSRHFRHNADNPLWLDLLVIDEASMVGLELMADLLRTLPTHARLYLIGDKDQLASVEAGALLGTLCRRADHGHYFPETATSLQQATGHRIAPPWTDPDGLPLDQAVVQLRRNYRFASGSGIGHLAQAIHTGDSPRMAQLRARPCPDLTWLSIHGEPDAFNRILTGGKKSRAPGDETQGGVESFPSSGGYRHYLELLHARRPAVDAPVERFDAWATEILRAWAEFQLLCASRQGIWGVEGLNARVERELRASGSIDTGRIWYVGRPVMVTRNDHTLGVMNGDIGITLEVPVDGIWWTRVAFWSQQGEAAGVRWFAPSRLPPVETVYAMTVHKSQGSEFGQVVLVIPDFFFNGVPSAHSQYLPAQHVLLLPPHSLQLLRSEGHTSEPQKITSLSFDGFCF
ncbi:MAG: exodeoxyribonuclease V subunit alpha [Magnetococcales bacterium]|nr:exodeoxyribonuclease V subunit alpha [Magnetococcales bacterium]